MARRRLWASVALGCGLAALVASGTLRGSGAGGPATGLAAPGDAREPGVLHTTAGGPPAPPAPAAPANMPAAIQSFPGLKLYPNGSGNPPDPIGDVDSTYYVQAVNSSFAVFSKSTGQNLGTWSFDSLFDGTGTLCDDWNRGDPQVAYDPVGGRWILADFAWTSFTARPDFECIAVSKTGSPLVGGWSLYAIPTDWAAQPAWFPDYPKLGVWSDGIYMSANMWDESVSPDVFKEARLWAFDRASLESGGPPRYVVV